MFFNIRDSIEDKGACKTISLCAPKNEVPPSTLRVKFPLNYLAFLHKMLDLQLSKARGNT